MKNSTRQLLHFVAVVELGSFSRAANELNLSQPALSRSIKHLEDIVGSPILDRGRHGAHPTELGQRLMVHGRNVRASLSRAQNDIDSWNHGITGRIVLGATSLSARHFIPSVMSGYLDEHPHVHITLVVAPFAQLNERMERGELDILVGPMGHEARKLGMERFQLFEDRLVIAARAGHPLLEKPSIGPADLCAYPWALNTISAPLRAQINALLTDLGLEEIEIAVESEASSVIIDLTRTSNYLSIHSYQLLKPEFTSGVLAVLPVRLEGAKRPPAVQHRQDAELTMVERSFIDYLRKRAAAWCVQDEVELVAAEKSSVTPPAH